MPLEGSRVDALPCAAYPCPRRVCWGGGSNIRGTPPQTGSPSSKKPPRNSRKHFFLQWVMGRTPKSPTEKRLTGASKRKTAPMPSPVAAVDAAQAAAATAATTAAVGFPPPPWLTDAAAVGVWNRIAPELRRLNILSSSDADVFGRYCRHFSEWIDASEVIRREGSTVLVKMTNSEERMPRLHPAVKVREVAEKHLLDIEDRFGGSPLARYRLIAQQAAHPGAFGDLFSQPTAPAEPSSAPAAPAPAASPIGVLQRATLN